MGLGLQGLFGSGFGQTRWIFSLLEISSDLVRMRQIRLIHDGCALLLLGLIRTLIRGSFAGSKMVSDQTIYLYHALIHEILHPQLICVFCLQSWIVSLFIRSKYSALVLCLHEQRIIRHLDNHSSGTLAWNT
jgi:hypothetical protein